MKSNLLFDRSIQIILVLIVFLSNTIFNNLQIFFEVILIIVLSGSISKVITKNEIVIIFLFIIVSIFSFFINHLFTFIINVKIFLIPLLIIIYYKNRVVDILMINIFFGLNIFLIVFQLIFEKYIVNVSSFISLSFVDLLENRPLGLFLNFHISSFFTAICLIYYLNNQHFKIKFFGLFLVFISGSFFTTFSYALSILNRYISLIFIIFFLIFYFLFPITEYLAFFPKLSSFSTILYQFFDFDRYKVLSFFPQDYSAINLNFYNIVDYDFYTTTNLIFENEIQYMTYLIQGGILFSVVFFIYYFNKIPNFYFFLTIAMLHYGYSLNPLIVLLVIIFQNLINNDLNSNKIKI